MDAKRRRLVLAAASLITARIGSVSAGESLLTARQLAEEDLAPTPRQAQNEGLALTPRQAEGPFYPQTLPLDRDNDLVTVAGRTGTAHGDITNIVGRVLDERGRPVRDVRLEIWQVNGFGRYHHEDDRQDLPLDPNFQGYGQTVTNADGAYRFRTVKPVAYPGRAPHIHFMLRGASVDPLTTQMYVEGAPENQRDFLLRNVRDANARARLIVPLKPNGQSNELLGNFDIVLCSSGLLECRRRAS